MLLTTPRLVIHIEAIPDTGDGDARPIRLIIRGAEHDVDLVLTAGEAAELMLETGFAIEQAARIARGESVDPASRRWRDNGVTMGREPGATGVLADLRKATAQWNG
jgi:hypothetical protein